MLRVKRNEKGFTLIELMIVIAIIGILAAIAVPQFMTYRMRAYNSAAKATVHNIKADNANLNSELGVYGHTEAAAANLAAAASAAPGAAADSSVAANAAMALAATTGTAGGRLSGLRSDAAANGMSIGFALGNNMIAFATDLNNQNNASTYTAFARHFKGDTAYAIDVDVENTIYAVSNPAWPSTHGLGALSIPPGGAALVADDINGVAGGGAPSGAWAPVP